MKKKEIIESGLLELYALEQCTAQEKKWVEDHLKDPDVQKEYNEIQEAFWGVAKEVAMAPNPKLKSKIFAELELSNSNGQLNAEENEAKVIPLTNPKTNKVWLRAAVIGLVISVGFNGLFMADIQTKQKEVLGLRAANEVLSQEISNVKSNYANSASLNSVFAEGMAIPVELKSINDTPQSAVVYWDKMSGQTMINAAKLPKLPQDKSYQLWCLIDGVPMDMGVIPDDMVGQSKLAMLKTGKGYPDAFAVTVEPHGGKESPSLDQLTVMGNMTS